MGHYSHLCLIESVSAELRDLVESMQIIPEVLTMQGIDRLIMSGPNHHFVQQYSLKGEENEIRNIKVIS